MLQEIGFAYEKTGGDTFEVKQLGNRYVVMPAKSKDEAGKLVRKAPILSTPININEMERDGLETPTEICKALSQASGIKVVPGIGPFSALARSRTRLAAVDEPARNVLARFLDGIGMDRERWILYNNPEDHSYWLTRAERRPSLLRSNTDHGTLRTTARRR